MKKLDIIVPVFNEAENIKELVLRIDSAMKSNKIRYAIVFVDDHSTDSTLDTLKKLQKDYPIQVLEKTGKKGKAYSILEGSKQCTSEIVAMIDGDLQYPPEALPKMYELAQTNGVVVANRTKHQTGLIRKLGSKVNDFVFNKLILGFKVDTQSGLKVFRKEIIDNLSESDVSGWTIDSPLLHTAIQLGYTIAGVDIVFEDRKNGESKVKFVKASCEIAWNSLKLKFRHKKIYRTQPKDQEGPIGAGIIFKKRRFVTHTHLPHHNSALKTFYSWQKYFFGLVAALFVVGLVINPKLTLIGFIAILSAIYFIDVLFSLYVLLKSLHFPPELSFTDEELAATDDSNLPIYTILCPLYREARVLPNFLANIAKLDWPKEKLDVLLLLEEDDTETLEAAKMLDLPSYVRVVVVPDSQPRTKPKACNYGLLHAKGDYVVIYDAEDEPDPAQLKKAYLGFEKLGENYFCLQSKLNYFNPHHNLLTRLFTAEYSLWFDVILPGLQSIGSSIPLGGTSNHFRTKDILKLHAWDPFNVTEDCDLGVRIFKAGYKTAIIDSTTYEEANSNVKNWIRQRSRWIKGYFQTYLVHTRNPLAFFKSHKHHALLFQLIIGMRMSFMIINPILWLMTIAYFALYTYVGPAIEALYPTSIFYVAVFSLAVGNFMYIYNYMIGCAKRGHWSLIKYVFFIPFYWLLASIASYMALYQLIRKPHFWEKTNHGLHLNKDKKLKKESGSLLKSTSILMGAAIVANVSNLVFNAYLGRALSIESYGLIALINNFFYISFIPFGALASSVVHKSANILGSENRPAREFWRVTRKKASIFFVAMALIWLALSQVLMSYFNADSIIPFIVFSPVWIIAGLIAIDKGFLVGSFKFAWAASAILVEALSKLVIAVVLTQLGFGAWSYLAIPISVLLAFVVVSLLARKLHNQEPEKALVSENENKFPRAFFVNAVLLGASSIALLSFDVILAKHYLSPLDAGKYALLSLAGKMIYFVGSLISQFIVPLVSKFEASKKDSTKLFRNLYLALVGSVVTAFIGFGLLGNITMPILFGEKVKLVTQYLPLYGLGIAFLTLASSVVLFNQARKRYLFAYISLFAVLVEIVLLNLFHSDLATLVKVVAASSALYFFVVGLVHLYYAAFSSIGRNVRDFLGLFQNTKESKSKDDSLNILLFNWRDTKHVWAGGAEVYVHEIAKYWIKQGHSITLFCGTDGKSLRNEIVDGVNVIRRGGFYTVYVWALLYYIFKFAGKFDAIVESENGVPFFTPLFSRKPKFLLIHHVNQNVFREYLPFPHSMIAMFIEKKLVPFIYKNTPVITVSASSEKDIKNLGIAKNSNVDIVTPGITLRDYWTSKKTKNPTFAYLGRLKPYKNVDVAIRAFAKVLTSYKDAHLTIAGSGESEAALKALVKELNINNAVAFAGKVSDEERTKLFARSWAALQPSSFEGWGITVIESNACGTPVIASDVSGLQDSIIDKKTGILVPVRNADAMSRVMVQLIEDPRLLKRLSKNCVAWAQNFSWEKSAIQFLEIIKGAFVVSELQNDNISLAEEVNI